MNRMTRIAIVLLAAAPAFAQFTSGNLVVAVEGNGVAGASSGPYTDNQAAPLTLFQFAPTGTSSVAFVNSLVFPQTASGANFPVSGEYGSSSEGTLQLSGNGAYLTIGAYGINAAVYNANPLGFTSFTLATNSKAESLAQSSSLTGQSSQTWTAVPRVVALVDANGNVNSSTALYNVFNTNNIRSVYTANGSAIYASGQGNSVTLDNTGGVFLATGGQTCYFAATAACAITSITGNDGGSGTSQETNDVQIVNNTLYVSSDSKEGSTNRDYIGTLGSPAATSLYNSAGGPTQLSGFGASNGKGAVTISTNGNGLNSSGQAVNISPQNYFFASPSVLYVADSGSPKNTSGSTSSLGDGGLQKWVNSQSNGSGTWSLKYTLAAGLNLVANTSASGTTGLYGLTGQVVGSGSTATVRLYATNYTILDLDPTYLYGITDTLSATANPGTSFTLLASAPADSNFKGVSFAPTAPAGSVEVTTAPSGLAFTVTGDSGCAPGSYTAPITLTWTPNDSSCALSVTSPQVQSPQPSLQTAATGIQYNFTHWENGSTSTSHAVTAPVGTATYQATFETEVTGQVRVTTSGFIYSRASGGYSGTITIVNTSSAPIAFPLQSVLTGLTGGVTLTDSTGTVSGGPYAGSPYFTVTGASSLAPGASVSFPIKFTYSGTAPISFVSKTISGTL
jgi:hypothetical protein